MPFVSTVSGQGSWAALWGRASECGAITSNSARVIEADTLTKLFIIRRIAGKAEHRWRNIAVKQVVRVGVPFRDHFVKLPVPQVRPGVGLTWDRRLDTPHGVDSVPYHSDVGETESEWTPEIVDENVGAPVRIFLNPG